MCFIGDRVVVYLLHLFFDALQRLRFLLGPQTVVPRNARLHVRQLAQFGPLPGRVLRAFQPFRSAFLVGLECSHPRISHQVLAVLDKAKLIPVHIARSADTLLLDVGQVTELVALLLHPGLFQARAQLLHPEHRATLAVGVPLLQLRARQFLPELLPLQAGVKFPLLQCELRLVSFLLPLFGLFSDSLAVHLLDADGFQHSRRRVSGWWRMSVCDRHW